MSEKGGKIVNNTKTNIISKEKFTEYINKIQEFREIEDNINKAGVKLEFFSFSFIEYETLILDLLEDMFQDKEDDKYGISNISYFINDLDFGKKYKDGMITINGENVKMATVEDLYDLLVASIIDKNYSNE